jgi:hypothetical protein
VVNAFLFVVNDIYTDAFPGSSIRSPFSAYPLSTTLENPESNLQRSEDLTFNITNPRSSNGTILDWVIDGLSDFTAQIAILLDFAKFFTAGYVIDLLNAIGLPANLAYIITVPFAIYVFYMGFVMITNRLGN